MSPPDESHSRKPLCRRPRTEPRLCPRSPARQPQPWRSALRQSHALYAAARRPRAGAAQAGPAGRAAMVLRRGKGCRLSGLRDFARHAAGHRPRAGDWAGRRIPQDFAMNVKDTNPKDAAGIRKVYFSTVPLAVFARASIPLLSPVVAEAGLALLEGWCKYGRHNYRIAGVRASVYVDATLRHLTARALGQLIDPDSRLPHLVKAIASITVLCDAMMNGKWTDDRPPPLSAEGIGFLDLDEKEPDDNAVAAMLAGRSEGH